MTHASESIDPALPAAPAADLASLVRAAVGGAGFGAGFVGAGEAALIWGLADLGVRDGLGTVLYAFGLHGALGVVAGLAAGLLAGAFRRRLGRLAGPERAGALLAGLAFAVGTVVVGTFRLVRDVHLGRGAAVLLALAGGVVGALVIGALVRGLLRAVPRFGAWVVVGCVGALTAGYLLLDRPAPRPLAAPGRATADRPNVILVVADTLRADTTGPYGAGGAGGSPTPHLDAFAREAVSFERMYANASWTRPAVASLLTGRLPSSHGVTAKGSALPEGLPTLATWFRAGGHAAAASVTNVNLAPDFGFGRGFDAYRYHAPRRPLAAVGPAVRLSLVNVARLLQERLSGGLVPERFYAPGEQVTADAVDLVEEMGDGPFFLWVHYMDPHDPFLARPLDGTGVARVRTPHPAPARADAMRALYEGEVRHWDAAFGDLMAALRDRGLLDHTLVAVTADHGEEFQDHGGYWHGQTLFDELVRVPLLVRLPGGARGGEVERRLASQVDVAPTLLEAAGLEVPAELPGEDLLRREAGGEEVRTVVMETSHEGMHLAGLVWERFKYVTANPGNPRGLPPAALYDLEADPEELRNLAGEAPERAADMAQMLDRLRAGRAVTPYPGEAPDVAVDGALEEDLRSLGYVQ